MFHTNSHLFVYGDESAFAGYEQLSYQREDLQVLARQRLGDKISPTVLSFVHEFVRNQIARICFCKSFNCQSQTSFIVINFPEIVGKIYNAVEQLNNLRLCGFYIISGWE